MEQVTVNGVPDLAGIGDDELRAAVRAALARLRPDAPPAPASAGAPSPGPHASHGRFALLPPAGAGPDADVGACVIEPGVRCTHCGYCQSYGH